MSAWEKVELARKQGRPTAQGYIAALFEDFLEMHGDRRFGDDAAVMAGVATFEGNPVTIIGLEKGRDTKERIYRNFGCANPEGYRKALRLMKQAEKFHRPVICIVDTSGAYAGLGAEERGQGEAIAENLMEMMTLKTPVITFVIGEGGSGGALALAVSDEVWMLENAWYSVISPEGCASILWRDTARVKEAAEALRLSAPDLLKLKVIERIIPEGEGAHVNAEGVYEAIRGALSEKLAELCKTDVQKLLDRRYDRFRRMGYLEGEDVTW